MKKGEIVFKLHESGISAGRISAVYKYTVRVQEWIPDEKRFRLNSFSVKKSECTTDWNVADKHVKNWAKNWKTNLMKDMNLF